MSTTSLQSFADLYSPFSSRSQPARMSQSQTPGLDTLAEGSQYALEQLQLARQAGPSANSSIDPDRGHLDADPTQSPPPSYREHNGSQSGGKVSVQQRDMLAEARSAIRKGSSSTPVRRRISRACDQCNQLRTKCDGQQPCSHCIGNFLSFLDVRVWWSITDES